MGIGKLLTASPIAVSLAVMAVIFAVRLILCVRETAFPTAMAKDLMNDLWCQIALLQLLPKTRCRLDECDTLTIVTKTPWFSLHNA